MDWQRDAARRLFGHRGEQSIYNATSNAPSSADLPHIYAAVVGQLRQEPTNIPVHECITRKIEETTNGGEEGVNVAQGMYRCKECGSEKVQMQLMQCRSADEAMTAFLVCSSCGNSWKK